MITQVDLNKELDLAKRIYIYYLDRLAALLSTGSGYYVDWYKDLCVLYFLTDSLQNIYIESDKLYCAGVEVDENDFQTITSKIREFVTYDIRSIVYAELDVNSKVKDYTSPIIPPQVITYQPNAQSWQSIFITIETDDITQVTLPFNLSDIVLNTIELTVNDGDPLYITSPSEEGFHIVGNTLYWHTYYNLKIDDVLNIRYLLNE